MRLSSRGSSVSGLTRRFSNPRFEELSLVALKRSPASLELTPPVLGLRLSLKVFRFGLGLKILSLCVLNAALFTRRLLKLLIGYLTGVD